MGMFDGKFSRWLGGGKSEPARHPRPVHSHPPAAATSTQFSPSQSREANGSPHAVRKEVLKVVLRELLQRNGIPESWLSADLLRTSSPRKEQGIHVRLLIRHWDPRLMVYGVALEQEFYKRLLGMDPLAASWLMGFSWQFSLADLSRCPPLPHPGSWTAAPGGGPAMGDDKPTTVAGDVIEGPVVIPKSEEDVRADLERLLALRDDDMKRHSSQGDGFAPTRPVQL